MTTAATCQSCRHWNESGGVARLDWGVCLKAHELPGESSVMYVTAGTLETAPQHSCSAQVARPYPAVIMNRQRQPLENFIFQVTVAYERDFPERYRHIVAMEEIAYRNLRRKPGEAICPEGPRMAGLVTVAQMDPTCPLCIKTSRWLMRSRQLKRQKAAQHG